MKRCKNLEKCTLDELIYIVHAKNSVWQKEATEYADFLLKKVGISDDVAKKRAKEILDNERIIRYVDMLERKQESFTPLELLSIFLFWFKHLFYGWYLNAEGYTLKRKQRLISMWSGFAFYAILIVVSDYNHYYYLKSHGHEHNQFVADTSNLTKTDWSGPFIFMDYKDQISDTIIWELRIKQDGLEFPGQLMLLSGNDSIAFINCMGLIKGDVLEIFPTKHNCIWNNTELSLYDNMFTLEKINDQIVTRWKKIKPFNDFKEGLYGFRKVDKVQYISNK